MLNKNYKFLISKFISTYCYIGYIKYAPGTFGSFFTLPLYYVINFFLKKLNTFSVIFIYMLLYSSLFYIAYMTINIYITKTKQKDPKEVVIDEVLGQLIPLILTNIILSIFNIDISPIINFIIYTLSFVFFRLFDITKPNLVGYFDRKNSVLGIIMDDIVAGFYSAFIIILLLFIYLYIY